MSERTALIHTYTHTYIKRNRKREKTINFKMSTRAKPIYAAESTRSLIKFIGSFNTRIHLTNDNETRFCLWNNNIKSNRCLIAHENEKPMDDDSKMISSYYDRKCTHTFFFSLDARLSCFPMIFCFFFFHNFA